MLLRASFDSSDIRRASFLASREPSLSLFNNAMCSSVAAISSALRDFRDAARFFSSSTASCFIFTSSSASLPCAMIESNAVVVPSGSMVALTAPTISFVLSLAFLSDDFKVSDNLSLSSRNFLASIFLSCFSASNNSLGRDIYLFICFVA